MDEIDLRKLILKGEDTSLEFKSKAKIEDIHDLAAEYVAFLNKRGGTLLLGVEDDGQIDGFAPEDIEKCNQKLRSMAKDQIEPPVMLDSTNVTTSSGIVIALTIEEGIDKPYQTRKGSSFYIRSGDEKRHVSHRDELRRLFQVGSHVYAEQQVLKNAPLELLDMKRFRDYYEARFHEDAPHSDEDVFEHLRRANLAQGDSLTLCGALLFARQPELITPRLATTKALWFEGTDPATTRYRADRSIEGSLPHMYDEAIRFLDAWNLRLQPEGAGYNDKGEPLVNPRVFEEILTNAFIHRDYFIPDSVKVFIFDDRIEIHSPGTLPNSLTLEEAMEGNSRSRNPIIEKTGEFLMKYRGTGTGLRRARQLHPSIRFDNNTDRNAFIVTIPVS
jgi:ATP-dependent DNA helicase RecG